jgi:hypothetical protein
MDEAGDDIQRCEWNEFCPNEATVFRQMNSCGDCWWSCQEHFEIHRGGDFPRWWVFDYWDFINDMDAGKFSRGQQRPRSGER